MRRVEVVGPLTSGEVAQMLRVTPVTVARWADQGKLSSFRTLGGHR
ncbi:helix-turn-helix domain-containing protein, partial [Nocardiopsis flavescens]